MQVPCTVFSGQRPEVPQALSDPRAGPACDVQCRKGCPLRNGPGFAHSPFVRPHAPAASSVTGLPGSRQAGREGKGRGWAPFVQCRRGLGSELGRSIEAIVSRELRILRTKEHCPVVFISSLGCPRFYPLRRAASLFDGAVTSTSFRTDSRDVLCDGQPFPRYGPYSMNGRHPRPCFVDPFCVVPHRWRWRSSLCGRELHPVFSFSREPSFSFFLCFLFSYFLFFPLFFLLFCLFFFFLFPFFFSARATSSQEPH
ncbi:hypothetical protein VTK73DRAFT_2178 [Phialemonium thermophilum]|uniref:Uncharacterized protein n=1 Tax=Phialemonium thermophilum TaxID=223376 RepID=A0ABR3VSF3_9PEZI